MIKMNSFVPDRKSALSYLIRALILLLVVVVMFGCTSEGSDNCDSNSNSNVAQGYQEQEPTETNMSQLNTQTQMLIYWTQALNISTQLAARLLMAPGMMLTRNIW